MTTDEEQQAPLVSRRKLILGGALTAGVVLLKNAFGQTVQKAVTQKEAAGPIRPLGPPPGKMGTRSAFEQPLKKTSATSSRTPLQDLYGTI
ncbi:MAG: sulfite dehydrogenase, partial [Bacteroidetes bacterium]|nr:sulfite dehydrogenase [Bacteroidota bacterium]